MNMTWSTRLNMKILNLYCGIGGNRVLWGNQFDITAVEIFPEIASIYKENFHFAMLFR